MSNFIGFDKMVFHICSSEDTDYRADFKSFYESSPELNGEVEGQKGLGKNFYAYYSSRLALLKCLQEMNLELPINRIKSTNHLHLDHIPHLVTSISHTEYLSGHFLSAATLAHTSETVSIGIDLEESSREISDNIQKSFKAPQDDQSLTPMQTWIRKEAVYKAVSPLLKLKGFDSPMFKEISVQTSNFQYQREKSELVYEGHFKNYEVEYDQRLFFVTIALIPA